MRHGERGQVLPLWIGAIITTLMFAFLAMNYGQTLRYQIRAQNAADSVAQGLMAIQAQRFNEMNVALYGTAVEEYRLRHLLQGVLLAANDSGGCQDSYSSYFSSNSTYSGTFQQGQCGQVYADLSHAYIQSLNRYTLDVQFLNDYSNYASWAWFTADTTSLMTHLENPAKCNQPSYTGASVHIDSTDCGFEYTIVSPSNQPTPAPGPTLLAVQEDGQDILVPGLGHQSTLTVTPSKLQFIPGAIDVTACAKIPPIVPNFGPLHLQQQYAVGRAAAENVQIEEDWMQPGAVVDPAGRPANTMFQPYEIYTDFNAGSDGSPGTDTSEGYNWYGINFGGNAAVAYVNYADFDQPTYNDEFSVRMGWWNAIAIKPFATNPSISTICATAPTDTN